MAKTALDFFGRLCISDQALRGVLADTGLSSALVRALPIALDLPPPSSAPASTAPGPACNEPVAAVLLATLWALCDMNPEICSAVMGMDPDTSDPSPDTGADTAESKPTGTGSAASHTVAAMLAAAAAPGAPESVRVQAFNAVGSLCLCGANAAPFLRVLPSLADALNAPLPDARRVALAALDAASQLLGDASAAAEARSVGVLRRAATLARLPSSDGASPDPDSLQVARRALNALASAASSGAGSLHAVASLPGALDAAVAALRPRVFAPWAFADEKEKKDEKEEKKGDGLRQRGGGRVEAATEGSEGGKGADSDAGDSSDGDAFRSWAR